MKKQIMMVICLTVFALTSVLPCVDTVAADIGAEIVFDTDLSLPVGELFPIGANVTADGDSIEFYEKTGGKNILIDKLSLPGTSETFAKLDTKPKKVFAKVLKNNAVVAESPVVSIPAGYEERKSRIIYDIDFESEEISSPDSGNWVYLTKDGSVIKNGKEPVKGHIGNSANFITTDSTVPLLPSSQALHMRCNGSGRVIMNCIYTQASEGTVVFEFDHYTNLSGAAMTVAQPAGLREGSSSEVWNGALRYKDGVYSISSGSSKSIDVGTDPKWHRACIVYNLDRDTITYKVDNTVIDTVNIGVNMVKLNRFSIDLANNCMADAWIDNIEAYTVLPFKRKCFVDVECYQYGEKVTEFTDGKAIVKAKIMSDGSDMSVKCFAAVYDKDKLVNIKISDFDFDSDNTCFEMYEDLDIVKNGLRVKIMVWESSGARLVPLSGFEDNTAQRSDGMNVMDDIYLLTTFDSSPPGNLYAKDNTLTPVTLSDGNNALLFERTGSQDFHWDLPAFGYGSDIINYQFDIKPENENAQFRFAFIDSSRNYWYPFRMYPGGVISVGGETACVLGTENWHTLTLHWDHFNGIYSVYVDGKKVTRDLHTDFDYENGIAVRWHITGNYSKEKMYLDNMAVYGGRKIITKIADNDAKPPIDISGKVSVFPDDAPHKKYLADKIGYHLKSGYVYQNGEKILISPKAYTDGDCVMVPVGFFETVFDLEYDSKRGTLGGTECDAVLKDGTYYLPLKEVCENVLSKEVFIDTESLNHGAVIIDDGKITPPSDMQSLNDFLLYERPSVRKISRSLDLSEVMATHPRLMATAKDFENIKQNINKDSKMMRWYNALISLADSYVKNPTPIKHELTDGIRLMYVAQDFQRKIFTLSMAYRITGNKKYADRAWIDMEAAATFADWNPSHHMDVGIMSVAYSVGYDWLYDYYTPAQRKILEDGAYYNCFIDYNRACMTNSSAMGNAMRYQNNHGPIMNAGAVLSGIAFYEAYPDVCAYLVSNGIRGLEYSVKNYAPDGAWYEGPAYAALSMEYFAYMFSSLHKATGNLYGFDCVEGIDKATEFLLYIQSPMGSFELTEGGSATAISYTSAFLWFADYFDRGDLVPVLYSSLYNKFSDMYACALLWYNPESVTDTAKLPKYLFAAGDSIITVRDSWQSDMKVFAAFKGSGKNMEHKHLNMGSFAFYANGVKWATDIGYDNYDLPGFFDTSYNGNRWKYYRQRAEAHNCLVIDPDEGPDMEPHAEAKFVHTEFSDNGVVAVLDMKDAYGDRVLGAKRGFFFTDNSQSLVVKDEIKLDSDLHNLYWCMQTEQNVSIIGNVVYLTDVKNPSNKLKIELWCSEEFEISASQSDPLPESPCPDGIADNTGKTRILASVKTHGDVSIVAKLTPCDVEGSDILLYTGDMLKWKL